MVRDQASFSASIGGLARAGGVGVETVRYYQRIGLMPVPATPGGTRRYDAGDLGRLRFIRQAQAAGFTLDEVRELLALDAGQDRARVRALARSRIAALDARIAALEQTRDALQALTIACGQDRAGPCPILAAFER